MKKRFLLESWFLLMKNAKKISLSSWFYSNRFTLAAFVVCILLFFGLYIYANTSDDTPDTSSQTSYTEYETATVISVLSDDAQTSELFEDNYVGSQTLLVEITSGQYKGSTMSALNYLGTLYGTRLKEGDPIVAAVYTSDGVVNNITVYEYNRTLPVLVILGVFLLITILIGGRRGAQSLLGLFITIVCLIYILIPLLIKGFPTLLTTFFLCIYVAFFSFILLGGISKKTMCACIGTISGMGLAMIFGLLAQAFIKVDGMRMGDYVDALLQLKQAGSPIQLRGLLIGGTMISALGAVMDVAMSISSAMQELTTVNPNLSRKDLIHSGMNIGRDMIGTMTNTLILAFVGSSLLMVIYIYSLQVPTYELLSSTLVATELVHSIASSIGVILSVPLTVFISTFFYYQANTHEG